MTVFVVLNQSLPFPCHSDILLAIFPSPVYNVPAQGVYFKNLVTPDVPKKN